MRLSSAVRVCLIIVLSVTIVWIGTVALFYLSSASAIRNNRPLPAQVAALVSLLEQASATQRPLILRAVTSQSMAARLEPGNHIGVTPKLQRVPRLTARAVDQYLSVLGGRPNSVMIRREGNARGGLGFTLAAPADLEIRVLLSTNETLVVDALSYPVANFFGVPVGFVAGLTGAVLGLIALFALQREIAFNRLQVRISGLEEARLLESLHKIANRISVSLISAALVIGAALALRIDAGPRLFGYPGVALVLFVLAFVLACGLVISAMISDRRTSRYRPRKP